MNNIIYGITGRNEFMLIIWQLDCGLYEHRHQFGAIKFVVVAMGHSQNITSFVQIVQCFFALLLEQLNFANFHVEQS